MRSGLLGLVTEGEELRDLVRAATRVTHRDPVAEEGALVVAAACGYAARREPSEIDPHDVLEKLLHLVSEPALRTAVEECADAIAAGQSGEDWLQSHGGRKGVSGWILRTVPAALLCWLRHPGDFCAAVEEAILLGGDADTTGAIVGALAGASVGASGIPQNWLDGILDGPRSVEFLRRVAARVVDRAAGTERPPVPLFWPALLPRNLLFLAVVLGHGFRRLFPPY